MKIGIVVPFSWSYWGGVIEHAEHQAEALEALGHEVRIICGHDPPGILTKLFHPRSGRHANLPGRVIPVGRSVVVPANGSLPNIVLSLPVRARIARALERERFDVLLLHEPMTPNICVATLAVARCPLVATWHAAGELGWMKVGLPMWGFLIDRIDERIAVSEQARVSAGAGQCRARSVHRLEYRVPCDTFQGAWPCRTVACSRSMGFPRSARCLPSPRRRASSVPTLSSRPLRPLLSCSPTRARSGSIWVTAPRWRRTSRRSSKESGAGSAAPGSAGVFSFPPIAGAPFPG